MQLKIRSLTGQTHDLVVPEFATVGDVKNGIKALLGIPNEVQRLIFLGRELADESKPITEFKVVDGSVLHLVIRANAVEAAAPAEQQQQGNNLRGSGYQDLEHQQVPHGGPAGNYQDPIAMGFLSERVYTAFRLARFVQLLTILDMIQIIIFAFVAPFLLVFLLMPIMGYWAASQLKPYFIIPYALFQLLTIALQIYIFVIVRVTVFGVLSILIDLYVFWLCVRFLLLVSSLSSAEKGQINALRNPDHSYGYRGYYYW